MCNDIWVDFMNITLDDELRDIVSEQSSFQFMKVNGICVATVDVL